MFQESHDEEQIIARVAALDIGKAELVCCVRAPAPDSARKRLQEVSTHSTMTGSLIELANRLVELRVERVVMEATSDYWKPVFYLLEAHGLAAVAGQRPRRQTPARVAQDRCPRCSVVMQGGRTSDAATQFRATTDPAVAGSDPRPHRPGRGAHREKNRVEKLLEDACIKLSVVASDIFGVSGRAMMAALIAGRARPQGVGADGTLADADQDRPARGGVQRPLRCPPRVPAGADAGTASTVSTPTSPPSTTRSRRIWPLSRRRRPSG